MKTFFTFRHAFSVVTTFYDRFDYFGSIGPIAFIVDGRKGKYDEKPLLRRVVPATGKELRCL
jgi:hypothetical protein